MDNACCPIQLGPVRMHNRVRAALLTIDSCRPFVLAIDFRIQSRRTSESVYRRGPGISYLPPWRRSGGDCCSSSCSAADIQIHGNYWQHLRIPIVTNTLFNLNKYLWERHGISAGIQLFVLSKQAGTFGAFAKSSRCVHLFQI